MDRRAVPGKSSSLPPPPPPLRFLLDVDNIGLPITSKSSSPAGNTSSSIVGDNAKSEDDTDLEGGGNVLAELRVLALAPRVTVEALARDMRYDGASDILRLL